MFKILPKLSRPKFLKFTLATLPLIFFNLSQNHWSYQRSKTNCFINSQFLPSPLTFTNLIEKTQRQIITIYSKQTNRPVGAGIIIHQQGIFITVSDIISDSEQCGQHYAQIYGGTDEKIQFSLINNFQQEGISICKLIDQKQKFPTLEIESARIGQQVFALSKDHSDINIFDSSIVLEKDTTLNQKLIGQEAFGNFIPFLVINHMIPILYGSPIFNNDGKLVGILRRDNYFNDKQVIYDANFLQGIVNQLSEKQTVRKPYLGLSMKTSESDGAFIIKINSDSPAEIGGMKLGEVIKEVDGVKIHCAADVSKIIGFQLNKNFEFRLDRDGRQRVLKIVTT